jgi:aminoglycoside phosphotransferase (APT) family kinase protein
VLRRKPAGKLLPSAHAVDREYRGMTALAGSGVPVAKTWCLCEDDAVIGSAFFVMDFVDGRVFWNGLLPDMANAERAAIYDEMNRVIAALHKVDYAAIGLADYGKPGNYFARQISRWSKQYQASVTSANPAMDRLIEWLPSHIQPSARDDSMVTVVHGDYRLDNLIFHPSEPRVLAVLDWELSTVGHALADFSYHCMAWHIEPGTFRGIGGLDHAALGIPLENDYVRRYCERSGRGTPEALQADWNFDLAYNLFRIAAIVQGIAKRVESGTAASEQARQSGAGARPLAELGWKFAQAAPG